MSDLNEKLNDEVEVKDEEVLEDTALDATETSGEEEAATIEDEVATQATLLDESVVAEPMATTEATDVPVAIEIDETLACDETCEESPEEAAEALTASGESYDDLVNEEEADELATSEDLSHSEAREELGIPNTEAPVDTPVSDALVNTEFVSVPGEGGENNIAVEAIDEDKDPTDYEVSNYDENVAFDDVEDDDIVASGENFWL